MTAFVAPEVQPFKIFNFFLQYNCRQWTQVCLGTYHHIDDIEERKEVKVIYHIYIFIYLLK